MVNNVLPGTDRLYKKKGKNIVSENNIIGKSL